MLVSRKSIKRGERSSSSSPPTGRDDYKTPGTTPFLHLSIKAQYSRGEAVVSSLFILSSKEFRVRHHRRSKHPKHPICTGDSRLSVSSPPHSQDDPLNYCVHHHHRIPGLLSIEIRPPGNRRPGNPSILVSFQSAAGAQHLVSRPLSPSPRRIPPSPRTCLITAITLFASLIDRTLAFGHSTGISCGTSNPLLESSAFPTWRHYFISHTGRPLLCSLGTTRGHTDKRFA